jgi:predicted aspartyl protease
MDHIVIKSDVNGYNTRTLIDGASNSQFINSSFARQHNIPTFNLTKARLLMFADGRPAQQLTRACLVDVAVGDGEAKHIEQITASVADLQYDLCLGRP